MNPRYERFLSIPPLDPARRRFVSGVALGGAAAALGILKPAFALAGPPRVAQLSGTEFDLDIGAVTVNFTGAARSATVVNGSLPAPILRMQPFAVRSRTANLHPGGIAS